METFTVYGFRLRANAEDMSVGLQGSCILPCILFCILTPNYDFGVADDYSALLGYYSALLGYHSTIEPYEGSLQLT
jgi:hypothetical protein